MEISRKYNPIVLITQYTFPSLRVHTWVLRIIYYNMYNRFEFFNNVPNLNA